MQTLVPDKLSQIQESALRKAAALSHSLQIFSTWSRSSSSGRPVLSQRELLTLKLVNDHPGWVRDKTITKIFNIHFSQVCLMAKKFNGLGYIEKEEGRRKSWTITDAGKKALDDGIALTAYLFRHCFSGLEDDECKTLETLLEKIIGANKNYCNYCIFDVLPKQ
jgi:DNA-binding MarR family transcriptional regulator